MKKLTSIASAAVLVLAISGCDNNDARVAAHNLAKSADMFELERRVVFYNGITGDYILSIEGKCSVAAEAKKLAVTCKVGPKEFKRHLLGISDNVTYFSEQLEPVAASVYHYRVVFKPQSFIPDVDFSGSTEALKEVVK